MLGGGAAGDLLSIWQRAALHLCQDALLVQRGFQEPCVAVKLHQVEDLPENAALSHHRRNWTLDPQSAGLFPEPPVSLAGVTQAPQCVIMLLATRQLLGSHLQTAQSNTDMKPAPELTQDRQGAVMENLDFVKQE